MAKKFEDKHLNFLKSNTEVLKEIFDIRIDQLKERVFDLSIDDEQRKLLIKYVQDCQGWKNLLGIVSRPYKHIDKNYK